MFGDERRVVDAFCTWLEDQGWATEREQNFVDVISTRDGATIYAEAKGRTASPGLDVDTLYGQLLRRIPAHAIDHGYLAVVVPDVAVKFAERVPAHVRAALRMHVYAVDPNGSVAHVGDRTDPAANDARPVGRI